jgi:hypothetical protein
MSDSTCRLCTEAAVSHGLCGTHNRRRLRWQEAWRAEHKGKGEPPEPTDTQLGSPLQPHAAPVAGVGARVVLTVRVPPGVRTGVEEVAARLQISPSECAALAVEIGLKRLAERARKKKA